jgi:outer membrane protein
MQAIDPRPSVASDTPITRYVGLVSPPPSAKSLGNKDMLENIKVSRASLLLAVFVICAGPQVVSAADDGSDTTSGWSGSVGLGVVHQPTYAGSPNERTAAVPLLSVNYHHPIHGTISLDPSGLTWTSPERAGFRVGVLVGVDAGREARGRGSDPFGIGDRGHAGLVADLSFARSLDLSEKFGLSLGASTRWADQKYQQAYFGVTPTQAAASRFSSFTPVEGFVQANVNIGLEYRYTDAWRAQLGVTLEQIVEEARASPLAEEPNSTTAFLVLARHFK